MKTIRLAALQCHGHRSGIVSWRVTTYDKIGAWRECHALTKAIYQATERFPKAELYGLTSQLRRASCSAATNIAEGVARRGPNELRRFLDISLGSLSEVSYLIRLSHELGIMSDADWKALDVQQQRARLLTWRLHVSLRPPSPVHSRLHPSDTRG